LTESGFIDVGDFNFLPSHKQPNVPNSLNGIIDVIKLKNSLLT